MAKALLIAEKNSMCNEIRNAINKYGYKDDIDFAAFAGHVVRQYNSAEYKAEWKSWNMATLPMIPEKILFKKDENKAAIYDEIERKIKTGGYDYLICATDAAREGNLIFAAFYDTIGCKLPVKRFFNNSLTPKSIMESMDNLLEWDTGKMKLLTDSAYLRSYFDSLCGFNFTRAYTLVKGSSTPINLGRVMTPVIRIVVDRELAIKNFKSETYHEISGLFKKDNEVFLGTALNEDSRVLSFKNKKDADAYINALKGKKACVEKVSKNRTNQIAPELFSLATLQNAANKEFGYSLQETLNIAQSLYENKWLSYPRTESSHLTKSVASEMPNLLKICATNPDYGHFVQNIKDEDIKRAQNTKKYVDDSKVSDHYALIPTEIVPDYNLMDEKQKNIYNLVIRQFIAIFYGPLVVDKTEAILNIDDKKFRAKGSILVDKGYTLLFNTSISDSKLPELNKDDEVDTKDFIINTRKTTPPKRYTEGTLNEAMMNANRFVEDEHEKEIIKEAEGIGKPSTRAQIVEKCINKNFLERKRGTIIPTEYAISIINDLKEEDITSVSLTAKWEEKLQNVEEGKLSYDNFYQDMIKYITNETEKLKKFKGGNIVDKNALGKCPLCGRPVIVRDKYYTCSNYKGNIDENNPCLFIIGKETFGAKINEKNAKLLIEGKETSEMNFKSKNGKEYKAKLCYSKEEQKIKLIFSNENNKSSVKVQEKTGEKCPKCGHDMVLKEGKYGKFEACSNYPACKYIKPKANADKETGEKCPNCGSPIVIKNGKFGEFKACSNYPACKTIIK